MQSFQHPPGPKLRPINLSPDEESDQHRQPTTITHGEGQLLPNGLLLLHEAYPSIHGLLGFIERSHAVAVPTITFMPESPEYLWGAASGHVVHHSENTTVIFEEITEPATNPPVSRIRIVTALGGWIIVEAQGGNQPVTVVDVQRAVIGWMREVRQRASPGAAAAGLSRWARITDWDGTEAEVEVWVWKGLSPIGTTLETWELRL